MRFAIVFSALMLFTGISNASEQSGSNVPATPESTEIEEVLVVGEQPGPKLWQVKNGEHSLYVLAMESPLPKNMQWKSAEIEQIIAQSQEMIIPSGFRLSVGFWGTVGALPSLIGIENNPDGKKLNQVLPPELYARWIALKEKYSVDDKGIEKKRPIFAVFEFYKHAVDKAGMAPNDFIRWRIEAVVKRHKIPVTHPEFSQPIKQAGKKIRQFKSSSLDDIPCFTTVIERMEQDMDGMVARANAWATGDIEAILRLPHPEEEAICGNVIFGSDFAQGEGLQNTPQRLRDIWVSAAESALEKNTMTFAYLPIPLVINHDGYLAALKAKGYQVDGLILSEPTQELE